MQTTIRYILILVAALGINIIFSKNVFASMYSCKKFFVQPTVNKIFYRLDINNNYHIFVSKSNGLISGKQMNETDSLKPVAKFVLTDTYIIENFLRRNSLIGEDIVFIADLSSVKKYSFIILAIHKDSTLRTVTFTPVNQNDYRLQKTPIKSSTDEVFYATKIQSLKD